MSEDESYQEGELGAAGARRARVNGTAHRQRGYAPSTVRPRCSACLLLALGTWLRGKPSVPARGRMGFADGIEGAAGGWCIVLDSKGCPPLLSFCPSCSPAWRKSCGKESPNTKTRAARQGQDQTAPPCTLAADLTPCPHLRLATCSCNRHLKSQGCTELYSLRKGFRCGAAGCGCAGGGEAKTAAGGGSGVSSSGKNGRTHRQAQAVCQGVGAAGLKAVAKCG